MIINLTMPTYNETETNGARAADDDIDAFIPYSEYAVLKTAQGLNPEQCRLAWTADCSNVTIKKRKHHSGVILMHHFKGMEVRRGSYQEQAQHTCRAAEVTSAEQLESLGAPAAANSQAWLESQRVDQSVAVNLSDLGGDF
jgi:hypothetical protein